MSRTVSIADRLRIPSPTHYTWTFPGSPITIKVGFDVVARLQQKLDHFDACGAHGVLWGQASGQVTEIRGFTLISGSYPPAPGAVVGCEPLDEASQPVGYFRFDLESVLRLNDDDLAFAESAFSNPHQVIMLIQSGRTRPANATFFFWDSGQIRGDFPFLEFPFDCDVLTGAERQRIQALQKATKTERLFDTSPADKQDRRAATGRARLSGFTIGAALLITGSVGAVGAIHGFPQISWRPKAPDSSVGSPVASTRQTALGLQAERTNGDLKLSWNRESGAVRVAISGVLSIDDGQSKRKIVLDPTQIRNGSILYSPISDQVQVQLTIFGQDTTLETMVVLLPISTDPRGASPLKRNFAVNGQSETDPDSKGPPAIRWHSPIKPFVPPSENRNLAQPSAPYTADDPPIISPKTEAAMLPIPLPLALPSAPMSPPSAAEVLPVPRSSPAAHAPDLISPIMRLIPDSSPSAYYGPIVTLRVTPTYPPELKSMRLPVQRVDVKVSIDETGHVTSVEALPSKTLTSAPMIQSSLNAARKWRFRPAKRGDQAVPSEAILEFAFLPVR